MSSIHTIPRVALRRPTSPAPTHYSTPADASTHNPMRVAIVVEAAAGGVAVHLSDLIPGLARRGVEVHLIAPEEGDRLDTHWLTPDCLAWCRTVTRVPMNRAVGAHDLASFIGVFKALGRIQPDIVHAHSSKAGVLARACPGRWRKIYTPHAVYTLNPTLKPAVRHVYGSIESFFGRFLTDRIIAVSDDEARHLSEALRIEERRIATIWNGVRAFERVERREARRLLGIRDDALLVGMVGRFAFQKGVDRFVEIARQVGTQIGERVQFVCIGSGDFAATAGVKLDALPSNVHVAGAIPDARRLFEAFDLFALPSRYEGFPYVYLEAVAAGVPIVSTRVAGADVCVTGFDTGSVVPNSDDVRPFADAIVALANDAPRRARLRANCAAAAAHFTAERMVDETLALYRQSLEGDAI